MDCNGTGETLGALKVTDRLRLIPLILSAEASSHALQDDGMLSNERNLSADQAIENANKNAKDILLNEAAHVVSDEVGLLKTNARLAASISP